jgi:catechol 2,3-dioxygenase-like lactoylglutathione lyase family enzyme
MRIKLTSVYVDDQDKALKFYTEKLGFVKKADVSAGGYRWLTVVSPEDQDGTQLVLEPNQNLAAKAYQQAVFKQDIRAAAFFVDDVQKEYERLKKLGVNFTMEPTKLTGTPSTIAVLDDTCGNLIQITHLQL